VVVGGKYKRRRWELPHADIYLRGDANMAVPSNTESSNAPSSTSVMVPPRRLFDVEIVSRQG